MSDQNQVLISEGRHATSYHIELGGSRLAACGKNAQHDQEFTRVSLEAALERGREPCSLCPIPDEWLSVDRGEGVAADGGHTPEVFTTRDDDRVTALVQGEGYAVLGSVHRENLTKKDVHEMLEEAKRELLELARREQTRQRVRADGGEEP